MSREQDFITEARENSRMVWDAINALYALQREWNALDYGSTLDNGVGDNSGVSASDVGAVVFATTDAFIAVLNAGNATNIAKLL